ncbi:type II toxin-antitoxin system RelE/ParE family toxin [Actinomadura violacea]|uniref:Type II toxin-antitoxin system RelE/ParE family toxin n=1 Tax=Actinomadura violacea TaxID=2819934 RepID=A0ABS3S090_9ACTN|nr:type II toxin-antitoxin system RelE/ParE family toxin [Actinomadura violacea]MBO2461680.1 type II toxin-antitoxin system RelE/ParE family toxin [Actinomadura violacea]
MPQSVRWLPEAWMQLVALPETLHKEGLSAAAMLMVNPHPDDAEPDAEIPDTFVLRRGMVRIFYRVVGTDVDVAGIWPNS